MAGENIREAVQQYLADGFVVFPVPYGSKAATMKNWQDPALKVDVNSFSDTTNIALRMDEKVDIDPDHPFARILCARMLPPTARFGRPSSDVPTHYLYRVEGKISKLAIADDHDTLIEIRTGSTQYAIAPPSTLAADPDRHKPQDTLAWMSPRTLSVVKADDLLERVKIIATITVIAKHWPTVSRRHFTSGMIAGLLCTILPRTDHLEADVCRFIEEAATLAGDEDVPDRVRFAKDTVRKWKTGAPVQGGKKLKDEFSPSAVDLLYRLWVGDRDFKTTAKNRILNDDLTNVKLALEKMHVSCSYNEFARRMLLTTEEGPHAFTDDDLIKLRFKIDEQFHFRPTKDFFFEALRREMLNFSYHPVKIYLDSLEWDGEPRIDRWLSEYAQAEDSELLRAISAIVLIAAVRRVHIPGCKFDEMLILESSRQGTLKSSALATLCPDDEWFSDDLPLGADSKQVIERTSGKWIIEASELHGHRQREADHMKSFLSRRTDGPVRLAYERASVEVPRQFIIIGTTNTLTGYFKDFSGSRRFWPVRVEQFDLEGLRSVRDQLWAEAVHKERHGASIRLDQTLWEDAEISQEERRAIHPWEELLTADPSLDLTADTVIVKEIWRLLGVMASQRNNSHAQVVAEIMQRHGYSRKERQYLPDPDHPEYSVQQWVWVKDKRRRS